MFSKKGKTGLWVGCMAAALLLSSGMTALEAGSLDIDRQGDFLDDIRGTEVSQTESVPRNDKNETMMWITGFLAGKKGAGTMEELASLDDGSEEESWDTEEGTTWDDGSEEESRDTEEGTSWSDESEEESRDTEEGTAWEDGSEEESRDTEEGTTWDDESEDDTADMEETIWSEDDGGHDVTAGGWPDSKVLHVTGSILAGLGAVLGVLMIFLGGQCCLLPGPESDMFLLMVGAGLFDGRSEIGTVTGYFVYLWFTFFILLVSLKGLWQWFRAGVPYTWSGAHRVGLRTEGRSQKHGRYLVFQFVWTILMSAGCIVVFTALRRELTVDILPFFSLQAYLLWMMEAGFLLSAVLAGYCFVKTAGDMDHLSEQLRHLHAGEEITAGDGVFADEERKLMDLERRREEAVRTAIVSERFRVDLISNVSHDLRTPLTAILGCGELLKGESLSRDGTRQLEELNRKAGYMYELVESLFELTKVSSGVEESKKERLDLIRLLEQTIGLFDDDLKKNNLEVRRHYESDSAMLETDGTRMHQVFANLVGNAIKYTLPGTRIHLEVKDTDQEYTIRMVNISAYEMDFDEHEILERFARGDKARSTKGSGLGLAIAKTYTESVGGSFRVFIDGEQFNAVVTLPRN